MSICPRVGGVADYLDRLRMNRRIPGSRSKSSKILEQGAAAGRSGRAVFVADQRSRSKPGLHGGMLFEELGFRYFGPIDGHNIGLLRKYLKMVKNVEGPCCCTS